METVTILPEGLLRNLELNYVLSSAVIHEPDDENECYWFELPVCNGASDFADSYEELQMRMRQMAQMYLEDPDLRRQCVFGRVSEHS